MTLGKCITEFIGTFFLMFTIGMVSGAIAPFAIAAILIVFVYAGGHISSGHYNPAVTIGVWLRGTFVQKDIVSYVIFQTFGALVAVGIIYYLFQSPISGIPIYSYKLIFIAEFLYTFALVFVVLNTATVKSTVPNSYSGLAIGLTVFVGALTVGSVSSAVFNPAIAVGLVALNKLTLSSLWLYFFAQIAGSAVAAYAYRFVNDHGTN